MTPPIRAVLRYLPGLALCLFSPPVAAQPSSANGIQSGCRVPLMITSVSNRQSVSQPLVQEATSKTTEHLGAAYTPS